MERGMFALMLAKQILISHSGWACPPVIPVFWPKPPVFWGLIKYSCILLKTSCNSCDFLQTSCISMTEASHAYFYLIQSKTYLVHLLTIFSKFHPFFQNFELLVTVLCWQPMLSHLDPESCMIQLAVTHSLDDRH